MSSNICPAEISPLAGSRRLLSAAGGKSSISTSKMFKTLGRSTLRGIRKCSKCGTLTGTRGVRCKNSACDQVFKVVERKKPEGPEAVKLITDPSIQIYSVRTKTGDVRGFVQLPIVQDLDGNPAVVDVSIVCSAAKCYVETCGRSRNEALEPCFHIRSSVEALEEAQELVIKESVLNSLDIPEDIRQKIWNTEYDTLGPLVQRISKNIMAVKTPISSKHPLGYLHYTFMSNKKQEKRFLCPCREAKTVKVVMSESGSECTYRIQRCVHFYACLCAFASNEELSKEFKYVLDADSEEKMSSLDRVAVGANAECSSASVLNTETDNAIDSVTATLHEGKVDGIGTEENHPMEIILATPGDQTIDYITPTASDTKRFIPTPVSAFPITRDVEPNLAKQMFMQWLNMVTEMINSTMHFQLNGNPAPLIFHIPQLFWDCLQQRISQCSSSHLSNKKRRLPDFSTVVTRSTIPPIGHFTQFSWYLTELSHVRKIFDTPEVGLLVSKYFDKHKNGEYKLSITPRVQVETICETLEPRMPSSTHEYKTYLRVGPQGNQGTVPFIIDWIPDLYPITHTGELCIRFQYSHLIDGLAPAVQDDMVKQVIENTTKYHCIMDD